VAAETGGLVPVILMNKCDLPRPDGSWTGWHSTGHGVPGSLCSARTGEGIVELAALLKDSTAVFVGQSGVGKSSLLNSLAPGIDLRVGNISLKHDRGNHTTNFSVLLPLETGLRIIDTPGIRELELAEVLPEEVGFPFPRFHAVHAVLQLPAVAFMTTNPTAPLRRPSRAARSTTTATRATCGSSRSCVKRGKPRMDKHTLTLLEWHRVQEELAGLCASPSGASLLGSQEFLDDRTELDHLLGLALEFRAILESGNSVPGFDFPDIEQIVPRLGKEGLSLTGRSWRRWAGGSSRASR